MHDSARDKLRVFKIHLFLYLLAYTYICHYIFYLIYCCLMNGFLMLDKELYEDLEEQKQKYDEDQKTRNEVSRAYMYMYMFFLRQEEVSSCHPFCLLPLLLPAATGTVQEAI